MQLYQGDCLETMERIPDGSIDMVLCDPPYGVTERNQWDEVIPFAPMWEQVKRITKRNAALCFFSLQPFSADLINSNRRMFRYEVIWEKSIPTGFLNANRMPLRTHENILVFYGALPTYNPQMTTGKPYKHDGAPSSNYNTYTIRSTLNNGARYPRDVQYFPVERGHHPTQKPVPLLEYLIRTYTNSGETVLDFTMGSGSTGVACVNAGREFIGIELNPEYFEIAKKRIDEAARQ